MACKSYAFFIVTFLALFSLLAVGCVSMPTPGKASIEVYDQIPSMDTLKVQGVYSVGPGWIVIHADTNGTPGEVLGYAAVKDGLNTDVKVTIAMDKKTPKLIAMLHVDAGTVGVYEFPGADVPVKDGDKIVMKEFTLDAPGPAFGVPEMGGGTISY
jgi:hypothetical protein